MKDSESIYIVDFGVGRNPDALRAKKLSVRPILFVISYITGTFSRAYHGLSGSEIHKSLHISTFLIKKLSHYFCGQQQIEISVDEFCGQQQMEIC